MAETEITQGQQNILGQQNIQGQSLTQDERMIAMFSHLSIFFGGLIVPLIFWALYREKSKFVSFHALQSLFFHIIYSVLMAFGAIGVAVVGGLTGLIGRHGSSPHLGPFQIIILAALGIFVICYIVGSIGYAVYLAINAYKGGMKKYPIIGNIIYNKVYGLK